MYKLLISIFLCLLCSIAQAKSFVSISPAMTEIMYSLGAEDMLFGVSTRCSYPAEAKNKEKIGNNFFINEERILKLHPDYILALDTSEFMLNKFKKFGITPLCFKYPDIESIYKNIITLGKITGKEKQAQKIIQYSKHRINLARQNNVTPKNILYLIETTPMITIGQGSFITDIIRQSGHNSITADLKSNYPVILEEYVISKKPDVIILSSYLNDKRIKKLFPDTKIIHTNDLENDIINRPGPRIYEAVEFFAKLKI